MADAFEVRKVANGYMVHPAVSPYASGTAALHSGDIRVFATFGEAVKVLAELFGEPRASEAGIPPETCSRCNCLLLPGTVDFYGPGGCKICGSCYAFL